MNVNLMQQEMILPRNLGRVLDQYVEGRTTSLPVQGWIPRRSASWKFCTKLSDNRNSYLNATDGLHTEKYLDNYYGALTMLNYVGHCNAGLGGPV